MRDPYRLLDIAENASDEEINKAYLNKVREYPPEQAPEQFKAIRTAFEQVKTLRDRINYHLFPPDTPDLGDLIAPSLQSNGYQRPSVDVFLRALSASLVNKD